MSNVAGKAYAMNVITPVKWYHAWVNRLLFRLVRTPLLKNRLIGLVTLSLIHYARWAIVSPKQFPRLSEEQPKETIKYNYMFFFSNFNGSWDQYVDSFHMAIPTGLNLFWRKNALYPGSVPLQPFHKYITYNQIWTNHYYNAYPSAASNDVKSAKRVKASLNNFNEITQQSTPDEFLKKYNQLLLELQQDICLMKPTPVVSLSAEAVQTRRKLEETA